MEGVFPMQRLLLALAIIAGGTAPAFAKYYVIETMMDKKCSVVDKLRTEPPKSPKDLSVVIGMNGFDTREEAEKHMHNVCKGEQDAATEKK